MMSRDRALAIDLVLPINMGSANELCSPMLLYDEGPKEFNSETND